MAQPVNILGIGIVGAVTILAGILTILNHFRYVPNLVTLLTNPARFLRIFEDIINRYRFKRFWSPIVRDGETIVVFPAQDLDDQREGTRKFDHKGLQELINELHKHFKDLDLPAVPDDEFGDEYKDHNIISASGPIPNRVTKELLYSDGDHAFKFAFDELKTGKIINTIVSHTDDIRFEPDMYYDERDGVKDIFRDYGIISRAPSPYDGEKIIINPAGGFGEGTLAGFRLLTMPSVLSRLMNEGGDYFQAVYTVSVDDEGTIQAPRVIAIHPIEPSDRRTTLQLS